MKTRSLVAGIIITAAFAAPFAASALSVDELQQQIKDLLARVAALQVQWRQQIASSTPVIVSQSVNVPRICGLLNRNLSRGQSGDDVRGLQEFLSNEGYLSASATGFFGPATAAALAKWQASEGVSSVGLLGPLTRERIKIRCGNQYGFRVTPQAGNAPLTVTAYANVGGFTLYRYAIDFGDGSAREPIACSAPADACTEPGTVAHTYTTNGTYTVSLWRTTEGNNDATVLAKDSVRVGDSTVTGGVLGADPQSGVAPLSVSFVYQPGEESGQYWIDFGDGGGQVMDIRPIYCIRAPCISPVGATHTYTSAGTYTAYVTKYIACMHTNPRCLIATIPLAKTTVIVTGGSNGAPVISGFSGPTVLGVNEIGTWNITSSDPENGTLHYSILWGDEWTAGDAANKSLAPSIGIQQTTSFTHSYARSGTYTVALTVRDAAGKEARATASVQVSPTVCTADYAPVCGRPSGCANTCPVGAYCTLQCQLYQPQTYSNRCQMNNSNATFMHDGVCTGNEGYLQ